jgi:hypothetical protein
MSGSRLPMTEKAIGRLRPSLRVGTGVKSRPACYEAFRPEVDGLFLRAVGKEVGFSLVRESPVASWTWVAWMIHTGAEGR